MEGLSQTLQPYKSLVAELATWVTIVQFFSGSLICKDIYKKGTTRGFNANLFIGGATIGLLNLKFGYLLKDEAMIKVNIAAVILNFLYLMVYYKYAENKSNEVLKPVGYAVAFLAILLGYSEIEQTEMIEFRFGMILTILSLILLGFPLLDVKEIITKKDASSIPFPITFMGSIVTLLWLIYGIILQNYFIIFQNVVGCTLCVLQLILIFLYPGEGSAPHED
ncbi:sugar transporter SWEET1 [Anthonomus grandis grandis]|uniref:sugar transporter SWEET1 n=1 Tax=Anthonomus grandis grandis TaxID=2921223 RepID=UPI0021655B77|nr:sugar transporter SWEET1 [Anthonomus grandis grandis]XP_050304638.1 sugar transporter SWEET1 [Anthonomus grandis grandis]